MEALKGLYHADKLDTQSFIDNFTIRLQEYLAIIDNLKQQKKKPLQHFLITGKRGMGKSTLLRRIFIEADSSPLNEKLFAVRLGAEQYRLSRLFKLWEMVIEQLSNKEPKLLEQKEQMENRKDYEVNLVYIIIDYLNLSGKTLLLLIDNFDQFISKIPSKDQHTLRELLMQYPIQIIGNTVFYDDLFKSYKEPFFDFFKPIHLANLNKEEAEEFIKQRAANEGIENFEEIFKTQQSKINTLRVLSGGVPRTLLFLLSIVSKTNTGDAVDYLHEMIELVTPLYQDRMKALSSQHQEIMYHLAMHWDRTPVKDLAIEMKTPSKSISAQLIQLEKGGYINKVDIPGRNHYYEIDERFFNIWLLMSEAAPHDAKRVIWLTKWLDAFYSNKELADFAVFCNNNLKKAKPGNRFLIAQALTESEKLSDGYKMQLVRETADDLKDKMPEVIIWANDYKKKSDQKEQVLYAEIELLIKNKNYKEVLLKIEAAENIDEGHAYYTQAFVYEKLNDFKKAENYYLKAVEKNNKHSMNSLGSFYKNVRNDFEKAKRYFLMAIEKKHIPAMNSLAILYQEIKKDFEKAVQYYLMAIEKGHAPSMFNLAKYYKEIKGDFEKAEKYYLMAIDKDHVSSMFNLAKYYKETKGDFEKAEKYFLMASDKGNIKAMNSLGILYQEIKEDFEKAEKYFLMASNQGSVSAMNNLGIFYQEVKGDFEKAEQYYLMAIDNGNISALHNLALYYQTTKQDFEKAEQYYLMAINKGNVSAMYNLAWFYDYIKKDPVKMEKYYLMAIGEGHSMAAYNLSVFYFYNQSVNKKNKALELILATLNKLDNIDEFKKKLFYIIILLWNERIKDAQEKINDFFLHEIVSEKNIYFISDVLEYFLVFKQKTLLYKLFMSEKALIDQFKPVYYALMHEMKDEYPKEYLKITEEIREPVEQVLANIKYEQERLRILGQ